MKSIVYWTSFCCRFLYTVVLLVLVATGSIVFAVAAILAALVAIPLLGLWHGFWMANAIIDEFVLLIVASYKERKERK